MISRSTLDETWGRRQVILDVEELLCERTPVLRAIVRVELADCNWW